MSITISSERAPKAFTSHHAMVTTTTKAMTTTNVDDEAHGRKYGIFLSRYNGDHDSKNQRRQTTTVGRRGLVLEHTTYSHRLARRRRGKQTS
jgi:hypothetical protein